MNSIDQPDHEVTPARSFLFTHRTYLFLLIFCTAVIYLQCLRFDFVTYDDYELVYQNGDYLSDLSHVVTSFQTHTFTGHRAESGYYRPLVMISFIFDYQMWQLHPFGYHLTNLLLHILTAIFVFIFLEGLFLNGLSALMGSLFFALHPIQTMAVAWVSGRHDALLGLFVAMMMVFYHYSQATDRSRRTYTILAIVSFVCALFTKESAVFCLLLLPLYDCCKKLSPLRTLTSKHSLMKYGYFIAILVVYLVLRASVIGEFIGVEKLYGSMPLMDRIQQIPAIVSEQCGFIFYPAHLSVVHAVEHLMWFQQPWMMISYFIIIVLSLLMWLTWRYDRIVCFGYLWFVAGLIPLVGIFPLAVPILEHRLYVPLMGIAIVFGRLVQLFIHRVKSKYIILLPAIVLLVCTVSSWMRLPVWENSETMWRDVMEKEPTESRSYYNLAGYYYEHGQYDQTVDLIKKYIELKPDDFTGYSKLRQTLFTMGRYTEAADVNRTLINRSPRNPNRYLEAATMFEQLNQPDSAVAIYREGLTVDSTFYDLYLHLALVEERQGNDAEAEPHLRRAVEIQPRHAPSLFALGMLYARRRDDRKAIEYIEEGLNHGEPPAEVVTTLVDLYNRNSYSNKAEKIIEKYSRAKTQSR